MVVIIGDFVITSMCDKIGDLHSVIPAVFKRESTVFPGY